MLRQILSITGKPGLFKLISNGNRSLIVEELKTGKRLPVHARDRVVSLGDIAMYTDNGDKPLGEILDLLYSDAKGEKLDVKAIQNEGGLKDRFAQVIPDFDRERVYDTDIKKLFTWYNALLDAGFTKFAEEKTEEAENTEAAE